MPEFSIHTLGCKANSSDSDALRSKFLDRGWSAAGTDAKPDVIVINTCSVTDSADRQSAKLATKLRRQHPTARIVMTGCAAEANPDQFKKVPAIDWIVGNRDRDRIPEWSEQEYSKTPTPELLGDTRGYEAFRSQHPMDREWPAPELFPIEHLQARAKTRLFLKIQEGCDSFCTYCIIPYGRGPSRSISQDALVTHVKALVDQGIREVVLTGTNLGDYGLETLSNREAHKKSSGASGLVRFLEQVLRETSIERIRLSSLDPLELGSELRALVTQEPRICPHFHVSLQSPVTRILRRMKRGYSTVEVQECLSALSSLQGPNAPAWIGMDLITGFPGETEAEFQETVSLLESTAWTRLHVFPYSERSGTPASRLPDPLPQSIRKERARTLQTLSFERLKSNLQRLVGKRLEGILWEGRTRGPDGTQGWIAGTSPEYLRVLQPFPETQDWTDRGTIGSCQVTSLGMDPASGDGVLITQATNH